MSSHRGKGVGTKPGRVNQDKCWAGGVISGQVESPIRQKVWCKLWFGASILWLVLEKTVICRELSCKNCDLQDKCWRGKRDLGCDSNSEITTLGLRLPFLRSWSTFFSKCSCQPSQKLPLRKTRCEFLSLLSLCQCYMALNGDLYGSNACQTHWNRE